MATFTTAQGTNQDILDNGIYAISGDAARGRNQILAIRNGNSYYRTTAGSLQDANIPFSVKGAISGETLANTEALFGRTSGLSTGLGSMSLNDFVSGALGTPGGTNITNTVDPNNPNAAVTTDSTGKTLSAPNPLPQPGALNPTSLVNPNPVNVNGVQRAPTGTPATNNTPATPQYPAQSTNQGVTPQTTDPSGIAPGTPAVTGHPAQSGYTGPSIVDYLKSIGQPADFSSLAALAKQYGIQNYAGTAAQNTQLLNTLRSQNPQAEGTTTTQNTPQGGANTGSQSPQNTANDAYAGLDPIAKQVKMYQDTYKALGLNTIKEQYKNYAKEQQSLTEELSGKIVDVNDNPWLSQDVRNRTIKNLQDKYQGRLDALTHLLTLTDSLYKTGVAQADKIISGANADIKAVNDLAQKQTDAANALAKDNQVTTIGNQEVLVNRVTGKTVAVLGPTAASVKPAPVKTSSTKTAKTPTVSSASSKGKLSNARFVELSLQRAGLKYPDALSQVPAGKVGVIENATGQVGAIDPKEYNTKQYTYL